MKKIFIKKQYCPLCDKFVCYYVKSGIKTYRDNKIELHYFGKEAYCKFCNEKIYVESIADFNFSQILKVYSGE